MKLNKLDKGSWCLVRLFLVNKKYFKVFKVSSGVEVILKIFKVILNKSIEIAVESCLARSDFNNGSENPILLLNALYGHIHLS